MTMGTATVRTKVLGTGDSVVNQPPTTRLMAIRVGRTASQIISAS